MRHGVLTERELLSRQEVLLENYIKTCLVETKLVKTLGRSSILPVALDSLGKAASLVASVKAAGPVPGTCEPEKKLYEALSLLSSDLSRDLDLLDKKTEEVEEIDEVFKKAETVRDVLLPLLSQVRKSVDGLELLIDDNRWPLPKYSELLWQ
jgi:glutamine synthetase